LFNCVASQNLSLTSTHPRAEVATMMRVALLLLACVSHVSSLVSGSENSKSRPVSKVMNMMKDMLKQLDNEGEQDREIYDTTVCWCETNEKAKTKAIADGEQHVQSLGQSIEALTGRSAQLNAEIKRLDEEVAANEKALESAAELRRKQLAEFNADEKDMLQSISSMKGAITSLSKHHESFLQVANGESNAARLADFRSVVSTINAQLSRHHELLAEVITPHQRKLVASFLQMQQPQSGEIFGIINGMKDSFENNLAQAQKEETANDNAFEDLKAAKTTEIADGRSMSETKVQHLADTDEKNAADNQDEGDSQDTLESDTKFLANVKNTCQNVDAEYADRTKTRMLEIEAVTKALAFLTSDEAHDLFTRTFNAKFIQRTSSDSRRSAVYKILVAAAKKSADPRLSTLAIRTRLAKFEAVKFALQHMIDPLVKEKWDEIEERDFCIAEINNNEKVAESKKRDQADAEAALDSSKQTIADLTKEIEELELTVSDAKEQFKRAGEDREKENHEFQIIVADQRATQKLLYGALKALKSFYSASLVQSGTRTTAGQTPPAGFEKQSNKGGIVGMVEGVIKDAQKLEAEAIRTEEEAQKAHEDFVKDTNDSFGIWAKDLVNKNEQRAKTTVQKAGNQVDLDTAVDSQKQNVKALGDLHANCDFLLKNFELRQATRDEEISSLKQATEIVSGTTFEAFIANFPR